ncbi:MAG: hypothetical protein S4CHLAM2_03500 [Chlamydiales bacterium]|nr:hypothetical protein [Chlamydiales bacterium]
MGSMFLQRKAIYNLLQINLPRIESGELRVADLQAWQTQDYRLQSTDTLMEQLCSLGISFGSGDFGAFAEGYEEPEEMLEAVAKERDPLEQDHVFLLIFELWRRMFPEKRTLSIFCDELDYQMTQYDLEHESDIADTLEYLLQILEENADKGLDPQEVFQTIQTYCANEVESFLFDYMLAQIEESNRSYASELLEGFSPFLSDTLWFDYLRARIDFVEDPERGSHEFENLIRRISEETSIDLVEEMLYFLADAGSYFLFHDLALKMFSLMEVEEDFREFLEICYIHFDHLELRDPGIVVSEIYHRRKEIASEEPLSKEDTDVQKLRALLDQKLHL